MATVAGFLPAGVLIAAASGVGMVGHYLLFPAIASLAGAAMAGVGLLISVSSRSAVQAQGMGVFPVALGCSRPAADDRCRERDPAEWLAADWSTTPSPARVAWASRARTICICSGRRRLIVARFSHAVAAGPSGALASGHGPSRLRQAIRIARGEPAGRPRRPLPHLRARMSGSHHEKTHGALVALHLGIAAGCSSGITASASAIDARSQRSLPTAGRRWRRGRTLSSELRRLPRDTARRRARRRLMTPPRRPRLRLNYHSTNKQIATSSIWVAPQGKPLIEARRLA